MTRVILFGISVMFFGASTVAAWYQGSNLVDSQSEWKYTAVFSKWLNGTDLTAENISQLDFFVYSVKYQPVFPVIMLISFVYILIALGERLLKRGASLFIGAVALCLFVGAVVVSRSPTDGAKLFMVALIGVGVCLIGYLVWLWKSKKVDELLT
ncbi:hypothetical protein FIU87_12910 [Bacillus sp. THAF10]|uniref:YjdJ family protein n=1 Tax=Bacillus sp. THAF10 TaxID=2587848 RepID=UPI001267C943|nr:YjdJ family protein [Bacillus sp. THAF10]QFT89553.1 hypothetical protein FIU87_12910 [Bacillus sp. THAF10]